MLRTTLTIALFGGLCACGGDEPPAPTDPRIAAPKLPPAVCNPTHEPWKPGMRAFVDATEKWGLKALGVEGVMISAVDINGDGRPDLAVRRGAGKPDAFGKPTEKRQTWLLVNTGTAFVDVTESSNLRASRSGGELSRSGDVWVFGDVDNDGDLDVYTGRRPDNPDMVGTDTSEIMFNDGSGKFTLGPEDAPYRLKPGKDAPGGAAFVDVDLDGNLDLFVAEYTVKFGTVPMQDRLYRGLGNGLFEDATGAFGLETLPWSKGAAEKNACLTHSNAWGAVACDLNADGWPELLVSSYGRAGNHLWLNRGGSFENRSVSSGYAWDSQQDYSDNESARCWCKLHPTDAGCDGVPPPKYIQCEVDTDAFRWNHATDREPYRLGGNSGSTRCADLNNDGKLDLVTSEIMHWDVGSSSDRAEVLYNVSSGDDVKFERPGIEKMGLGRTYPSIAFDEGIITLSVFDFDNDGREDIYWGGTDYPNNRGLLYHQRADGKFESVPLEDGIDHHRSHGSAVADFDGDGDLDIVVGHSLMRCNIAGDKTPCYATAQVRLFENQMGGNFVQLRLSGGPGSNRSAIGARVEVSAGGLVQTKEVGGGFGHSGQQDDLTVHIGLGQACEADVTIHWPNAERTAQQFRVTAGHVFYVEQGKDPVLWSDRVKP